MRCLAIIESYYRDLTKSEKKVADYVAEAGEKVIYMSLQEMTQDIGVGEATVIRFCKKIGFQGFQDFKMELAKEDFSVKYESFDNYLEEIAFNYTEIINRTMKLIESDKVDCFTQKALEANKMYIYGVGASGIAAKEAEASFLRMGIDAKAILDPHYQAMNSAIAQEDSLILAFSLSGTTKDIYDALSIAKENGVYIVSITNYPLSPIGKLSDLVFTTARKESIMEGGSLSAKISQLYVIDILTTAYSLRDKERALDVKTKVAKSIMDKSIE